MERLVRSLPSGGVAVVMLAAFSISLTNVAAPVVYQAGGNTQTILFGDGLRQLLIIHILVKIHVRAVLFAIDFRSRTHRGQHLLYKQPLELLRDCNGRLVRIVASA
jgi:hypothetical protein